MGWGNFLAHERLVPDRMSDPDLLRLLELIAELTKRYPTPTPFRSYADRIKCREQICTVAMELGFDLTAIRHKIRGKVLIGRDYWMYGTQSTFNGMDQTKGHRDSLK